MSIKVDEGTTRYASELLAGNAYTFGGTCTFPATPTCPGGITPTDGQCITRPGSENQP
jgi:hypothetical protein